MRRALPVVFGLALIVFLGVAQAAFALPNDPFLRNEWALGSGQGMNVARAWALKRHHPVVVAVIDTGVEMDHPELRDALWTNGGEVPGNGIDDDGNGYVDDVHGYDFVGGDPDPSDDNAHGTGMAAEIAAPGNDDYGMAGVAWNAEIMALKAADANGDTVNSAVAPAIRYATENGAQVINLSLEADGHLGEIEQAIREAGRAGVTVVVAAGNEGRDLGRQPVFPAAFGERNIVTVASVDRSGALGRESNRGTGVVDVAAPGENVLSADLRGYAMWSGTSIAAANVSGVFALLAGSCRVSADALRSAVITGARPGPDGIGTVDVAGALERMGRACTSRPRLSPVSARLPRRR